MNENVISQKLGVDQISEYNEYFMGLANANGLSTEEVIYMLIARAAAHEMLNVMKLLKDQGEDDEEEVALEEIKSNLEFILLQVLIDERNDLLAPYVANLDNEARSAEIADSIIAMAKKGGAV